MDRRWIIGGLGFLIAFGAERLFASLAKDIARYEKMRAMSGDPPLIKELLGMVGGAVGERGAAATSGATGFIASMTNDIVRYAKMKGM